MVRSEGAPAASLDDTFLSGARIGALCELEGLTRTQVGERVGVTQGFVSQVCSGIRPLSAEFAARLASEFELPVSFFKPDNTPGSRFAVTYRKRASTRVRDDKRIGRMFAEASRVWFHAAEETGLPPHGLPSSTETNGDAETAAQVVREKGGVATGEPVRNVTRLMERLGVGVLKNLDPHNAGARDHVGISRPASEATHPLVALADLPPGGVQRLTVGHEVGHLIFDVDRHLPIAGTRSPEEKRAYRFGGAILVPADVMRANVDERTPLREYLALKGQYGITVSALIQRAADLGLVSSDRKRSLFIQMSSQGWRSCEPVTITNETTLLFGQAVERRWPELTVTSAAEDTGVPAKYLQSWMSDCSRGRAVTGELSAEIIDFTEAVSSKR